jgi:predicted enzyme related to lactoylglutathione lyase
MLAIPIDRLDRSNGGNSSPNPITFAFKPGLTWQMTAADSGRVVHLELHTRDLLEARCFYRRLCGWREERVETSAGSYLAVGLGDAIGGGMVECPISRPLWLPYVEVRDIHETTERAQGLGATIMLSPREGPVGWRSVVSTPTAGEIALWQPKR